MVNTGRTHWKIGNHPSISTEFKKGHSAWNKGKKGFRAGLPRHNYDDAFKIKISKSNSGRISHIKDKTFEERYGVEKAKSIKKKMADARKNKLLSRKVKEKIRNSTINYVEEYRLDGKSLYPCVGKYETQILDNLEKCISYPILRQFKIAGYFLDGYCPALNLAIEVDESFHNRQLEKDQLRQKNIADNLSCQFLRIEV